MSRVTAVVLGATSYTGIELLRLLRYHPGVTITAVSSQSYAGKPLPEVFPAMRDIVDLPLLSPEDAQGVKADCVFSCLPHAVSAGILSPWIDAGARVVDLSADFRLTDAECYAQWYKTEHPRPSLLDRAVYGLPEHNRAAIIETQIVANPGCYPTSILLPLIPLLNAQAVDLRAPIIADSKSGVSGAGRSLKLVSHFVEAHENLSAYGIGRKHRHVSEIDQELSSAAGSPMRITFSPHLVPLNRGILSTIYFRAPRGTEACRRLLLDTYKNEPFVRVNGDGTLPAVRNVAHTNYCDISVAGDSDEGPTIAVCVIDNLLKGASGQALQNMNIMFGFEETTGLLR